jgi:hypothetical protein
MCMEGEVYFTMMMDELGVGKVQFDFFIYSAMTAFLTMIICAQV